ncbi:acyltransferase family protein [Desertivirga arenae]|uniref:acyltransferase family protein n=1 Tax=Desertivirga arenae TaxID=2810309 RepID=UPI001A96D5FD|nr:acyltransferase [Pedobacter sp. SYSU D00823]
MTVQKNLGLESIRGFASVYVALGHWIILANPASKFLKLPFLFGQEAVIIFFILSGYVIQLSWENTKNKTFKNYFIKRFRRIYFPFLVSIILTLIVTSASHFSFWELIGNLLMLQDFKMGKPGNIVGTFSGNFALWSLSYEWWFYMMFPLMYPLLKSNRNRLIYIGLMSIAALVLYIFKPNHMLLIPAYFIIWWAGVELAWAQQNKQLIKWQQTRSLMGILCVILAILFGVAFFQWKQGLAINAGFYPVLFIRHFGFALVILGVVTFFPKVKSLSAKLLKPFSYVSPISYSLYIFHVILLIQFKTSLPFLMDAGLKLLLLFVLCYVTEIKLQPLVNRLVK